MLIQKSRAGLSRERLQQHVLERTFAKTELTYLQKMKVIALISIYVGRPGGVTATRRQAALGIDYHNSDHAVDRLSAPEFQRLIRYDSP